MKEITENLKRDVKDLLTESANLVTGFFKRGACTVRAVAGKWKAFAQDISDAVDALMEPPFMGNGPEAPAQELDPEAEPVVTVMESEHSRFPVGMKLTLSQANELVATADMEQIQAGGPPVPVQFKIDYTKDSYTDCYWLPLEIGSNGDLLTQMEKHIDRYLTQPEEVTRLFEEVPEYCRDELYTTFAPMLVQNLHELSGGVLNYFRRHCDISTFERTSEIQAQALPEAQGKSLLASTKLAVKAMRRAANTGQQPIVQHEKEQSAPIQQMEHSPENDAPRPRRSVKLRLRRLKGDHDIVPVPPPPGIIQEDYQYYSTQRPIDIGTFPNQSDNQPTNIQNFDVRTPVENGAFMAWGVLTYAKPLTADEVARFELRPSRLNLDVYQAMFEQAQIVGPWEQRCKVPAEKRVTLWNGISGIYIPARDVMPEQLAERCRAAKKFPDGPPRRSGANRPRPHEAR